MLERALGYVDAPVRASMAALFIISGYGKVVGFTAVQSYMESAGLPGILIVPTIALEIGGGVLLVLGLWTRYVALLLAAYSLATALIFHTAFADQSQLYSFFKNIAMAGGFLLLAKHGAPGFSIAGLFASRRKES